MRDDSTNRKGLQKSNANTPNYSFQLEAIRNFNHLNLTRRWRKVDNAYPIFFKNFEPDGSNVDGTIFVLPGLIVEQFGGGHLRPIHSFAPYLIPAHIVAGKHYEPQTLFDGEPIAENLEIYN